MSADSEDLFHIALPDDWTAARRTGEYRVSTRGHTFDQVGFIHCARAHQLVRVANFAYADLTELLVLGIDDEGLDIRAEPAADDTSELFPHLYGPLPTGAVVSEDWWERGGDGVWHRPPFIR